MSLPSSMIFSKAYDELSFYTLSHPDQVYFIHQHVVDAQIAQTADANTKQISIVFSLVGLYLALEQGYTGRQVQQAHMQLAENKNVLPNIFLPAKRGGITVINVMNTVPGQERDSMIRLWCASVWEAYKDAQILIRTFTSTQGV